MGDSVSILSENPLSQIALLEGLMRIFLSKFHEMWPTDVSLIDAYI
jgi:hypothetical protein